MATNTLGNNVYQGVAPSDRDYVQGWNSNEPVFGQLVREVRPHTIVEIGSWRGASAIEMAAQCNQVGITPRIYCVDTWLGAVEFWTTQADTPERDLQLKNGYPQIYHDFLANIVRHNLQEIVVPVPNTSSIAAKILRHLNVTADLIYIDGSHEYEDVREDIRRYLTILRPGGVLFGDDYTWASVQQAVDEELSEVQLSGAFWIWRDKHSNKV